MCGNSEWGSLGALLSTCRGGDALQDAGWELLAWLCFGAGTPQAGLCLENSYSITF